MLKLNSIGIFTCQSIYNEYNIFGPVQTDEFHFDVVLINNTVIVELVKHNAAFAGFEHPEAKQ